MHFQVICGRAPELLSLKTALALIYRFSYILYFTVFPLNWSVLLNSLYQHIVQVVHSIWWYSLSTQCQEILKMKEIRCITTFRIFLRELFFFFSFGFSRAKKTPEGCHAQMRLCNECCKPSATAAPENHIWQAIYKRAPWLIWPPCVAYVSLMTFVCLASSWTDTNYRAISYRYLLELICYPEPTNLKKKDFILNT